MAYGQNRTVVATTSFESSYNAERVQRASDTFDSSISASWTNGDGDWGALQWVSGGHIEPAVVDVDCGIRRTGEAYGGDQYSKMVMQEQNPVGGASSWLGVYVRGQSGANESAYLGTLGSGPVDEYQICEIDSAFGFTVLTSLSDPGSDLPISAGDTATMEAEGSTLRLGCDAGGSDVQKLTTTDATLTSGAPGINLFRSGSAVSRATSWEGGTINASNWENPAGAHFQMTFLSGNVRASLTGDHCYMHRNVSQETYTDNQWAELTLNDDASSYLIVGVRGEAGSINGYRAVFQTATAYFLSLWDSNTGETLLVDGADGDDLGVGDTLTLEADGSTLRVGGNDGTNGDREQFTHTDATYSEGVPGVGAFTDIAVADTDISAWRAGNIGLSTAAPGVGKGAQESRSHRAYLALIRQFKDEGKFDDLDIRNWW